ncbi:hypothetical protein BH23BAC3_BH23BAC3_28610 [soil metagenome]
MMIKKTFFVVVIVSSVVFTNSSIAQEISLPNWHTKVGIGSYSVNSNSDFESGFEFSSEIGYRMHTGFDVGIGYSMALVRTRFNSDLPLEEDISTDFFSGLGGQETHHALRLLISYHIPLNSKETHILALGTGLMITGEQKVQYDINPTAIAITPDEELFYQFEVSQFKESSLFSDVGFPFNAEYIFRFTENLAVGLRAEGRFLFNSGFDRHTFAPKIVTFF